MKLLIIMALTHLVTLIVGVVGGFIYRGKIEKELNRG